MNPNLRRRLKYVAPLVVKKVSFENLDRKYVGLEHIESWTGRILYDDLTTLPEGTVSLFEPNDVLFGKLRPYLAKVSLVDFSGACSTEALVLRPKTNQWPPFVRYVLSNGEFIDDVNSSTFGAKMPRASWEFIGSRTVPVPDLPTQKAIADFLDRETARIDQLIEKKQRMVSLLSSRWESLFPQLTILGLIMGVINHILRFKGGLPMNLISIFELFPDQQACIDHLEVIRWGKEPHCPHCGSSLVARKKENDRVGRWNCHDCSNSFNVLRGTIFQGTQLPLQKWFLAIALMVNAKKSISSCQLGPRSWK